MRIPVLLKTPITPEIRRRITQLPKSQCIKFAVASFFHGLRHHPHFVIPKVIEEALKVIRNYQTGKASVQDGRLAALAIHHEARTMTDLVTERIYRAAGHMVATLHVKTHASGPYLYLLSIYHYLYHDASIDDEAVSYLHLLEQIEEAHNLTPQIDIDTV